MTYSYNFPIGMIDSYLMAKKKHTHKNTQLPPDTVTQ